MHSRGEKCIQIVVHKVERKRALRRHKHRWKDNIRMHSIMLGYEDVNWMSQGKTDSEFCEHSDGPSSFIKSG
jgi:hypothetical protein